MAVKSITFDCPHCKALQTLTLGPVQNKNTSVSQLDVPCASCQKNMSLTRLDQETLEGCPVCGNFRLYQHKDFNKKIGIGIFILGVIFSFWTYHISLIIALILDAALYPLFPWMIVCYACESEYRGWPKNPKLDRFNHEIASHYEYGKKSP